MSLKKITQLIAFVFIGWIIQTRAYASSDESLVACNDVMGKVHSLNAYELWQGANVCGRADDLNRATFLILSGQIRAMTDMGVLTPASDEDEIQVGELYGKLYYQSGGSGDDEIYRDVKQTSLLFSALQDWSPRLTNSYDPGWKYKSTVKAKKYGQMLACQKAIRIEKLKRYASLVLNDNYYKASKELNALRANNPGSMTVGSEVEKQFNAIMSRMREVSTDKSAPMENPKACEFAQKYEPDPDADFSQLYIGANGHRGSEASVYASREQVIGSWISKSLSPEKLTEVLGHVNFERQILVSLSFGKRQNATGTIYISGIDYNSLLESLSISGLIGVNKSDCEEPNADSYPFALAVAPRPEKIPTNRGMFSQNFGDSCKPTMKGAAVTK